MDVIDSVTVVDLTKLIDGRLIAHTFARGFRPLVFKIVGKEGTYASSALAEYYETNDAPGKRLFSQCLLMMDEEPVPFPPSADAHTSLLHRVTLKCDESPTVVEAVGMYYTDFRNLSGV